LVFASRTGFLKKQIVSRETIADSGSFSVWAEGCHGAEPVPIRGIPGDRAGQGLPVCVARNAFCGIPEGLSNFGRI
jgi:hypothetical protein